MKRTKSKLPSAEETKRLLRKFNPEQAEPAEEDDEPAMRTVGVKIPVSKWKELKSAVKAERLANPNRRYTVSDAIRERLCNTPKTNGDK